jgi:dTDP-4-amino-4,6-dideoxygalactose transaminase
VTRRVRTWPATAWSDLLSGPRTPLPFPLDRAEVQLYARARQALLRGLPALGLQGGDEVLVPTYHHGSEISAVLAAGLRCVGYELDAELQPDEEGLVRLLTRRTRALHLIHYLGFPQDVPRWRAFCDRHGLLLVEDGAQAWLSTLAGVPVGSCADLAVFCLYKTTGLPDGAAAWSPRGLPPPEQVGANGTGALLRWAAGHAMRSLAGPAPARAYDAAKDMAVPDAAAGASTAAVHMVRRTRLELVKAARRASYRMLLEQLHDLVPPPFATLPSGGVPFAFPVAVHDKSAVLSDLRRAGIDALDLWREAHPQVPSGPGTTATRLRRQVIGLPVHAGVRPHDLQHISDVVGRSARLSVR